MKFTSKLIKAAWAIRRQAAQKFSCKIMEISWRECLIMASETRNELPELIGTEKQVKWAEQIRADLIITVQELIDDRTENITKSESKPTSGKSEETINRRKKILTSKKKSLALIIDAQKTINTTSDSS